MSGVIADDRSVIRSGWNGKADMSDVRHKLTWINAAGPPAPVVCITSGAQTEKRADAMPLMRSATSPAPLRPTGLNASRRVASYAGALTEMRLRQALAQAEALLREQDLLIHAMLGWREAAADHLAGLTRRQRQVMDLVLAGQPSKNIAADLGISQRTVENHRAAIMKKTGTTCLPALARLALAATWNDAPVLPPPLELRNTGDPDLALTRQPPADRCRGSAAGPAAPCPDPARKARSTGHGVVAVRDSPMPNTGQGASVTNFPTPIRCRSK
ncbi:MAG: LuxR C-terminal-related transcriptional regulator [Acetobacteraceae bacterium]